MTNLDNFRQAVESPKSWYSMGYISQKKFGSLFSVTRDHSSSLF